MKIRIEMWEDFAYSLGELKNETTSFCAIAEVTEEEHKEMQRIMKDYYSLQERLTDLYSKYEKEKK